MPAPMQMPISIVVKAGILATVSVTVEAISHGPRGWVVVRGYSHALNPILGWVHDDAVLDVQYDSGPAVAYLDSSEPACDPAEDQLDEYVYPDDDDYADADTEEIIRPTEPERWLPVVGFEGLYEVSNLGQVKSLARTITRSNGMTQTIREKVLCSSVTIRKDGTQGRPTVRLSRDGYRVRGRVDMLVDLSFA